MKKILILLCGSVLPLAASLALNTGCAATGTHQSTGEYIDDATITTKVKSAFATDDTVKATSIHVDTLNGTVQLSGYANSSAEKMRAEQIARNTAGVRGVINNITLK
ncbi:MAG TPA: BON domain-containing protein [Candidatus Didemnitutus sp.]|nr:BON domain-containing protein [Candidatus Didemnitutus sp.]